MTLRLLQISTPLALLLMVGAGCATSQLHTDLNVDVPASAMSTETNDAVSPGIHTPLDRAWERVTRKHLGTLVSPRNSPVSPERFMGYHTGTDFETFPEEQDTDVTVRTICDGKVLRISTVEGYGGVLVQACRIQDTDVTVLYGHLRQTSITVDTGDVVAAGTSFAVLGKGYSVETDGERKHLHLGISRGTAINLRGYASTKAALSGWMDAESLK